MKHRARKQQKLTSKIPNLTRKQESFVKQLIENPGQSSTQAVLNSDYKAKTYWSAAAIASENLKKPQIVSELAKYNDLVESTIINTIARYRDSNRLSEVQEATSNARWVHDKIYGRATQQIESHSISFIEHISHKKYKI